MRVKGEKTMRGFAMGEVTLRTATQQDAGFLYDLRKTTMKRYITSNSHYDYFD